MTSFLRFSDLSKSYYEGDMRRVVLQNDMLYAQKLKTKGHQRVIVQYQQVNVSEGGQAVVAKNLRGGSGRKRRDSGKNRG